MASNEVGATAAMMARSARREHGAAARSKGKGKNRNISKDESLMVRAAVSAFLHKGVASFRGHREVARDLGLNPQAVGPLLEEGFKRGIFSVVLHLPQERADVARLEDAVKAQFGLKQVLLVPGLPEMLEDLDSPRRRAVQTQVIRAMAPRLAEYVDALVAGAAAHQHAAAQARQVVRPFVLGVAWGRTMHLFAEHLLSTPRQPRGVRVQVVPIVGITSVLNPEPVEANVIAMDVARAYHGVSAQLPCPAFVPSLQASVVTQSDDVRQMLRKVRGCDTVITSMGPIPEGAYGAADITLSNDPVMNEQLFKSAFHGGAIGEVCYWLFDRDGAEVRGQHQAIGLGFEGLRTIARDPQRHVILMTGGDRRRIEPLRVALGARLASVLVSDTITARALLESAVN